METLTNERAFCAASVTRLSKRHTALEHAYSCVAFQVAPCHEAPGCKLSWQLQRVHWKALWHLGLVRVFLQAFQMEHFSGTLACALRPRLVCLQQQFTSGQEHTSEANQPVNPSNCFLDCITEWSCITGNQYFWGQHKPKGALWHCT